MKDPKRVERRKMEVRVARITAAASADEWAAMDADERKRWLSDARRILSEIRRYERRINKAPAKPVTTIADRIARRAFRGKLKVQR